MATRGGAAEPHAGLLLGALPAQSPPVTPSRPHGSSGGGGLPDKEESHDAVFRDPGAGDTQSQGFGQIGP